MCVSGIGWGDNNIQKHCVHVQFDPILVRIVCAATVCSVMCSQGAHATENDFRDHFVNFGNVDRCFARALLWIVSLTVISSA